MVSFLLTTGKLYCLTFDYIISYIQDICKGLFAIFCHSFDNLLTIFYILLKIGKIKKGAYRDSTFNTSTIGLLCISVIKY
nr:MAG TPA: hypothetical protein [Caudoviricetes sp.]